jgi:hypothetical protein
VFSYLRSGSWRLRPLSFIWVSNNNIILTHKIIKLKYLTDKNYFVKVDKKNKNDNHNQNNNHKRSESKNKPKFTPEEHAAYLERKKRREQNKHGGKKILVFC